MNLGFLGLERMGPGEIILIVVVLVLIFGARKIPELARSLGRSVNEFKKGQAEGAAADKPEDAAKAEKKDEGESQG